MVSGDGGYKCLVEVLYLLRYDKGHWRDTGNVLKIIFDPRFLQCQQNHEDSFLGISPFRKIG